MRWAYPVCDRTLQRPTQCRKRGDRDGGGRGSGSDGSCGSSTVTRGGSLILTASPPDQTTFTPCLAHLSSRHVHILSLLPSFLLPSPAARMADDGLPSTPSPMDDLLASVQAGRELRSQTLQQQDDLSQIDPQLLDPPRFTSPPSPSSSSPRGSPSPSTSGRVRSRSTFERESSEPQPGIPLLLPRSPAFAINQNNSYVVHKLKRTRKLSPRAEVELETFATVRQRPFLYAFPNTMDCSQEGDFEREVHHFAVSLENHNLLLSLSTQFNYKISATLRVHCSCI